MLKDPQSIYPFFIIGNKNFKERELAMEFNGKKLKKKKNFLRMVARFFQAIFSLDDKFSP